MKIILNFPLLLLLFLIFIFCNKNEKINITGMMLDGMESELIRMIYADAIRDVYELTGSEQITIYYYEMDLNNDGHKDIIAVVISPLHSGLMGNTVNIFQNDGNGGYHNILHLSTFIYPSDTENGGRIDVTSEVINGFFRIEAANYYGEINALVFMGGRYVYV
jgi:hypothetical protein